MRSPCTKLAHGECGNLCCRLCCVILGGCQLKAHREAALSANQLSKVHALRTRCPNPSTTALPLQPDPPSLNQPARLSEVNKEWRKSLEAISAATDYGFSKVMERDRNQMEQERLEFETEKEMEQREEEDFQRALQESRELCAISPSPPSGSPLRPSTSRSLHLPLFPVTRVTTSNMPTITTQMNADWMRTYEDRTKGPIVKSRAGQADAELVQKFRIVWWAKVRQNQHVVNTSFIDSITEQFPSICFHSARLPELAQMEDRRLTYGFG